MTWTKSSPQHAREMESLVKTKGCSTPNSTQDQPEDTSVGKKSSATNEQPKRGQYIAIGKSAVPQSLLTGKKRNKGFLETAGEYISEKIDEALDYSHKAYSPLTHPDTKKQASDFIKDKINGKQPAHKPVTETTKQGWNNMIEKELLKQKNKDTAARNLKPSKVTDIFSSDPNVRKNRINTIKAGVEGGLKNYVDVQLSTPDTVIAPTIEVLEQMNNIMKKNKKK
ncbi:MULTISPECIES: hypothetical protein [unclassified Maridesulfovibrio]|uniref:hypothetical protein n=1 Tax=unclassified Maridesulfovibrio TaxID=2794999 RepID=UPI003B42222F